MYKRQVQGEDHGRTEGERIEILRRTVYERGKEGKEVNILQLKTVYVPRKAWVEGIGRKRDNKNRM